MSTKPIDGKTLAAAIRARTKTEIAELGFTPGLGVILVGDDAASHLYVNLKEKACLEVGIRMDKRLFPAAAAEPEILAAIRAFDGRTDIDAILVQLPLPPHLDADRIVAALDPKKDVDGFHPTNAERYLTDETARRPVLVAAIEELLRSTGEAIAGQRAVMVANSETFFKPVAKMLERAGAAVAYAGPDDVRLADRALAADILIGAVGRPGIIVGAMVKPGATVIDVGTTRVAGRTVGDVDATSVQGVAGHLTPVPGGVGPMTVAMLMAGVVELARARHN